MKDTNSTLRTRVFGLDLMRAAAIVFVVYAHAYDLLGPYWPMDLQLTWFDGVDLFFVLSGYLVGGILLRTVQRNDVPWYTALLDFWQRRWLRTLPNYYLFLLVNIILVWTHVSPGILNKLTLTYFVFLQNFHAPLDLFFWESWSLSVEEWFYLLLPIVVFAFVRSKMMRVKEAFLFGALIMIVVPTVIRFAQADDVTSLFLRHLSVRKLVIKRLDIIGFGVLAAWVHHYFPLLWPRGKWLLFVAGIIGIRLAAIPQGMENIHYLSTWSFTFTAIAITLFLPALSTWNSHATWTRPIAFVSRISYALYLVHLPLRYFFLDAVEGRSLTISIAIYIGFWLTAIAAAAAVYRWYELPFMLLRGRLTKRLGGGVNTRITSSS